MKALLDTHVWIKNLAGSYTLPANLKDIIENDKNELWLSPISIWEAIVLGEKGRLELKPDPVKWVRNALTMDSIREAPINIEVAVKSRQLQLPHQDPADRFIAATAIIYELKLLTMDKVLLDAETIPTIPF